MSHCTENHNMDLTAWYKSQKLIILGKHYFVIHYIFWSKSEAIWDVMLSHHFLITLQYLFNIRLHIIIVSRGREPPFGLLNVTKVQYRTVWHSSSMIFWDCHKHFLGGKILLHNYFGRISSLFHLWKVPTSSFLVRRYSVTCCFFLAILLLDKKAWEVARHVFCYCLDIN